MKNMKKVLFLLLSFVVLGAAGMNAQVRIGGNEIPNEAAVLDLNTDDLINDGARGLALPRVSLNSNDTLLGYSDLLEGMLVYNTNADMDGGDGVGVYYWDGNEWVKSTGGSVYEGSASIELSGNSFQRAALTGDITAAANSNATSIAAGAVTRAKTTLSLTVLSDPTAIAPSASRVLTGVDGCNYNNSWFSMNNPQLIPYWYGTTPAVWNMASTAQTLSGLRVYCFK